MLKHFTLVTMLAASLALATACNHFAPAMPGQTQTQADTAQLINQALLDLVPAGQAATQLLTIEKQLVTIGVIPAAVDAKFSADFQALQAKVDKLTTDAQAANATAQAIEAEVQAAISSITGLVADVPTSSATASVATQGTATTAAFTKVSNDLKGGL